MFQISYVTPAYSPAFEVTEDDTDYCGVRWFRIFLSTIFKTPWWVKGKGKPLTLPALHAHWYQLLAGVKVMCDLQQNIQQNDKDLLKAGVYMKINQVYEISLLT